MSIVLKVDPNSTIERLSFKDRARFAIELGLCQVAGVSVDPRLGGVGVLRGVRVNDLNPLWPKALFRDAVMKYAKLWVREYHKRGYELAEPESEMRVWGPYRPYDWSKAASDPRYLRVQAYHDPHALAIQLGVADFLLTAAWLNPYGLVESDEEPSQADRLAVALVDEREQAAMQPYQWRS